MKKASSIVIFALHGTALAGCRDSSVPTSPNLSLSAARVLLDQRPAFELRHACDPTTFAGVPGGCQRDGGVSFDQFIAQVTRLQSAPEWKFSPTDLFLQEGDEYVATNFGGEQHTFTEVDEFGGGIVPIL